MAKWRDDREQWEMCVYVWLNVCVSFLYNEDFISSHNRTFVPFFLFESFTLDIYFWTLERNRINEIGSGTIDQSMCTLNPQGTRGVAKPFYNLTSLKTKTSKDVFCLSRRVFVHLSDIFRSLCPSDPNKSSCLKNRAWRHDRNYTNLRRYGSFKWALPSLFEGFSYRDLLREVS